MPTDSRAHLPSASSFERLLACPGSFHLSQGQTPPAPKPWTQAGILAHRALAGETEDQESIDNQDDLTTQIDRCEQDFAKLADTLNFTHPEITLGAPGAPPVPRLWLHDHAGEAVASGRPDRVLIQNGIALIADFKLGRKPVTAPALNPQLIGYALLLQEEYGIDSAYLQIIQPWAKRPQPAHLDPTGLATWRRAILAALAAAKSASAPRHPGPHCDYCPARPLCAEARTVPDRALTLLGADPAPTLPRTFAQLSATQKLQLWDWTQHAKRTLKDLEDLYKTELTAAPQSIPGLRLKPGPEQIKIPATPDTIARLRQHLGTDERLYSCASFHLTSLASVAAGGSPSAKTLNRDGQAMKKLIRQELGSLAIVTNKAASIERI